MRTPALADTPKGQATTALLLLAAVFLPLGLLLPALETREIFWRSDHTILGFGWGLIEEGEFVLAAILLTFSAAFPIAKLIWMTRLHFGRVERIGRFRLRLLDMLGKWSLADVLVIALIVTTLKDSLVFAARPLPGVFAFAASTAAAMLASGRIAAQLEEVIKKREEAAQPAS